MSSKLFKKDTQLNLLLTNKDIMFIKINNFVNENDKLRKILRNNITGSKANKEEGSKYRLKRGRSSQISERFRERSYIHSAKSNSDNNHAITSTNSNSSHTTITNEGKAKEIVNEENNNNSNIKAVTDSKKSTNNSNTKSKNSKKRPKKLLSEGIQYDPVFK